MKLTLSEYLSHIARAAVVAAQEGTRASVKLAQRAKEDLSLDCDIGGVNFHVEGAANLPKTLPAIEEVELEGGGYLEYDADKKLRVRLKRGLSLTATPIKVKVKLTRSAHLESLETMRERAVELVREEAARHQAEMANITVEAMTDGSADEQPTD